MIMLIKPRSIMLDVEGAALTAAECAMLIHSSIYGVVLFARNYENKQQLTALIADIKKINHNLQIAVDHEGGRVQRFLEGFYQVPSALEMGRRYDQTPDLALNELKKIAQIMARELKEVGIDINFAPVVDVEYSRNSALYGRSFHEDYKKVAVLGKVYARELEQHGIKAVAKHFPGHGYAQADSHFAFAIDERDYQTISEHDLYPFAEVIKQGIFGIMAAHVVYDKVEQNVAGFSSFWLRKILRDKLKFEGTVFSDDLNMFAAGSGGNMRERVQCALHAGCDVVLICNNREGVRQVIES